MSVGNNRHCRIDEIDGTHFIQTAERAGLPGSLAQNVLADVAKTAETAMNALEKHHPSGFPEQIHVSVKAALKSRLKKI